ncbi:hypothetical protein PF005_g4330 [Phytophthora fragariae]|uniref:Secreted protein n=2 Tax=Phytophthora TaxID=4783 RepID=A0A6A3M0L7_9STRA|nr:hypothetical protein PF003_g15866 [Phytophthora fragariae]KAE9041027.1 hypothetical protein PR002_g4663 [Phytophthora rubi]KAE8946517.1 hypothetical protein PF009_g3851 [Phytophthora fragariae]KAE9023918.1 hypothetical protein PF011_g3754 [Phytophthora fragariae]KAE9046551.1 hypothetical protein PR001_g4521 [Phytophthora rubi]
MSVLSCWFLDFGLYVLCFGPLTGADGSRSVPSDVGWIPWVLTRTPIGGDAYGSWATRQGPFILGFANWCPRC